MGNSDWWRGRGIAYINMKFFVLGDKRGSGEGDNSTEFNLN